MAVDDPGLGIPAQDLIEATDINEDAFGTDVGIAVASSCTAHRYLATCGLSDPEDFVKFFDVSGAIEVPVGSGNHSETGDVGESVEGELHLYFGFSEEGGGDALDDVKGDAVGEFQVVFAGSIFNSEDFCSSLFDGHCAFHVEVGCHFGCGGAWFDSDDFDTLFS